MIKRLALLFAFIPSLVFAATLPLTNVAGQAKNLQPNTTLATQAPTTANASINLPHGTAPTSPVNGDLWTTTSGLFADINGVTVGPFVTSNTIGDPFCFLGGFPCFAHQVGTPSSSLLPAGSLILQTDNPYVWLQLASGATIPAVVQATAGSSSAVFGANPTPGNWMVAFCSNRIPTPGTGAGWIAVPPDHNVNILDPAGTVKRRQAVIGESPTQAPCTNAAATVIFEVSGITDWNLQYGGQAQNVNSTGGSTLNITTSTTSSNTLVLGGFAARAGTSGGSITGLTQFPVNSVGTNGGDQIGIAGAAAQFPTSSSTVNATGSIPSGSGIFGTLILLTPGTPSVAQLSLLSTLKQSGTAFTNTPLSLNFSTGLTATDDGLGNFTITNAGVTGFANPTATASDVAVNGTATTAMRSDAAPAVQKGSASQFGILKCDGTTITCTSGVASASVTGASISGTPTTGDCAKFASATSITDAGAACGSGGGGTSGGVAFGNYNLISSQTLGSAAGSVSFSSIPQGYSDLIIVTNARGDTAAANTSVNLQFNGDTGANYDREDLELNGGGGTVTSGALRASTSMTLGYMAAASAPSGVADIIESHVGNYSGSTFQKAVVSNSTLKNGTAADSNLFVIRSSGWWRSAAAVTSLTLTPGAGNFATGSTFYLYGRGGNAPNITLTNSMTLISHTVTSGSQSSASVSIPSGYTDLHAVVSGRGTNASATVSAQVQLNSDTAANYDLQQVFGVNNSTAGASAASGATSFQFGDIAAASAAAGASGSATLDVFNYGGTTFAKQMLGHSSYRKGTTATDMAVIVREGDWRSTSAVTNLTFTLSAGSFVDGTVIDVYGIGGSQTVSVVPVGSGGTGQTSFPITPQGRLTLTSNTPVMNADATAQGTIYYTPYVGGMVSLYDGTRWNPTPFSQISYALNTTAHVAGSLYDIGMALNGGVAVLCTAPAWTSSTARSAAISQLSGLEVNTASLTCNLSGGTTTITVPANQWLYLGTFYATANGQTGVAFAPTPAAGGTANIIGLSNAYNRKTVYCMVRDSTANWTVANTSWGPTDAGATGSGLNNRCSFVDGLQQSQISGVYNQYATPINGKNVRNGMSLDSTTATPQVSGRSSGQGSQSDLMAEDRWYPQLGFHFIQMQQLSDDTSNTATFAGSTSAPLSSMVVTVEMGLGVTLPGPGPIPIVLILLPALRRRRAVNDNAERKVA